MNKLKPIICKGCGKKRVPFLGSKNRPTKFCKECKGGSFWTSAFGLWFLDAASRQSIDSMPFDNDDVMAIYQLWLRRRQAQGTRYVSEKAFDYGDDPFGADSEPVRVESGKWQSEYKYQLCHLDPVAGKGFQGRLTAKNLVIAPAINNQTLGNSQAVDHGFRVHTDKVPFKDNQAVKAWCTKTYNIAAIAQELKLKSKSTETPQSDLWLSQGSVAPSKLFVEEVNRLGGNWTANSVNDFSNAFDQFLQQGVQGSSYIEYHYGKTIDEDLSAEDF
ncbi:hypothetical protein Shal_3774 [Shewanella halifaxensis HAW-EB4]|uniref:Uncharacterized protein n=1 Tax=Shewanella halifaxensis (strain HAW-EB4) TaxID=458817 RepID=B0TV47_SHEHH|nr:hypothetical protein [Shewanella halifaxensis]ABZ78314.1 hypothetical protein Shal_3774 [Shewanella halifaxensis HAW-EB4]